MKARLVDTPKTRKSQMEAEAATLLSTLTAEKAIEVTLDGASARAVRHAFTKAAKSAGVEIRLRKNKEEDKLYVQRKDSATTHKANAPRLTE